MVNNELVKKHGELMPNGEDMSVPVEKLPEFRIEQNELIKKHQSAIAARESQAKKYNALLKVKCEPVLPRLQVRHGVDAH